LGVERRSFLSERSEWPDHPHRGCGQSTKRAGRRPVTAQACPTGLLKKRGPSAARCYNTGKSGQASDHVATSSVRRRHFTPREQNEPVGTGRGGARGGRGSCATGCYGALHVTTARCARPDCRRSAVTMWGHAAAFLHPGRRGSGHTVLARSGVDRIRLHRLGLANSHPARGSRRQLSPRGRGR
jgi:hypothetical protein